MSLEQTDTKTPSPLDTDSTIAASVPPLVTRAEQNRLNAQKSTGPKTPAGKNRSRANALKHGATGELLHRGQDRQAANLIHKQLRADYHPEGVLEEHALERLTFYATQIRSIEAQISTVEHLLLHDYTEEAEAQADPFPPDLETASLLGALRVDHPARLVDVDRLYRYLRHTQRDYERTVELFLKLRRERRRAGREFRQDEKEALKKRDDLHFANSAREQLKLVPEIQSLTPQGLADHRSYLAEKEQAQKRNEPTQPEQNQQPEQQA